MISLSVGVIGAWWSRWTKVGGASASTGTDAKGARMGLGNRLANATALAGLAVAIAALLAVGLVVVAGPILVSLQGPDPCGAAKGVRPPDPACASAHPAYYQPDPATGYLSTPALRLEQELAPAWPAALVLALNAALISWLAVFPGWAPR
jgi:hypothetical protein